MCVPWCVLVADAGCRCVVLQLLSFWCCGLRLGFAVVGGVRVLLLLLLVQCVVAAVVASALRVDVAC